MTSIRIVLLNQLVTRLAANVGWDVALRDFVNPVPAETAVRAVVFAVTETKVLAANTVYAADLQVGVLIVVNREDADPTLDAGNAFRYLDRMVVLAEKTIHTPDAWGVTPDYTDVVINGHDVHDPEEENECSAMLRLTFTYRHSYQDPEV